MAAKNEKPLHSLLAGATAGAIEAFVTYPTEFVKTRSQFGGQRPFAIVKNTVRTKGITGLYSGCTALVVGNSLKAGVRFVAYDYFKKQLADKVVRDVISVRTEGISGIYRGLYPVIFTEEGLLQFWTGTTPRLTRLVLSGGIVFTIYENIMKVIG
ncbi:mitochondrial carrier domain-containing protein [Panaeolus papilionaceus]|nr:mitochondrial carrier domain-containing protein [Panaeolus papilionaceus]